MGQRAPPDEAELLKSLGNESDLMKSLGQFMGQEGMSELAGAANSQKPTIATKTAERKEPEYSLESNDAEGQLELVVSVPGLDSMQGVDLDVTEKRASLAFPSKVGLRPLQVELPAAVIPT